VSIDFLKERSIKYLNKDFRSFKRDLIRFTQAHNSGVFGDFSEASPGMAILEMAAYVGDVLSFHQDMQYNEIRQESARQVENVVSFAKSLGYRPAGKRAARGVQSFFVEVPATTISNQVVPNDAYAPILRKGARVGGPNGTTFETLEDLEFYVSSSDSPRYVTGSRFDSTTGLPTHFAIKKDVATVAGETKTDTFTLTTFQQFLQLELTNADVIEVISVVDSDSNTWTEVGYLAQDTVFDYVTNPNDDVDEVPSVLKLVSVPRRFVTDRDPTTGKTSLIFGSGDGVNFDDELLPNLADLALPLAGRRTFTTVALDPQNFLKTRSLGLSPFNTTLTVTYRVGGGAHTNVPAGTIRSVDEATLDFTSTGLDASTKGAVVTSLDTINVDKTSDGGEAETITEIKANSAAFFAAQNRVVTREDYVARVMTLPARFGKPAKVHVKQDGLNPTAMDLHVLAYDTDGHLTQATSTLTQNIRTYLRPFRMLTDGVNILQTNIINLGLTFGIVVGRQLNRTEVLAKCLSVAKDYLDVSSRMQIGRPIVMSDLSAQLQAVYGVISVYRLEFRNILGAQADGTSYSSTRFDVRAATSNGILYCPEDSIFEVKYPNRDIVGESK
jgi:hypothetical protein